jgi:type IX secretion system PorP/SprF family membrane protein
MKLKNLLLLFFLFVIGTVNAQDIHFSQFNLSQMTLNPAKAGSFKGTFRIGGVYRDQWASVIENQYVTPTMYLDIPAFRGIGKKDWIGIGIHFLNDQSGSFSYRQVNYGASLAYHLALDAQRKNVLTIGGQAGQWQRRVDRTAIFFEDQYDTGTNTFPNTSSETGLLESTEFIDYAAGIDFRGKPSSKLSYNVGVSAFHLTEPEAGNIQDPTSVVPRRLVGYASATAALNTKWQLTPQVYYTTQAGTSEIIAQAIAGYRLGANDDFILNMGAGYRVGDAAMVLAGVEYKNLVVGIAYDLNVSPLSTYSNYQGGFEIGVGYIVRIPKSPTIPPVIFNPRF